MWRARGRKRVVLQIASAIFLVIILLFLFPQYLNKSRIPRLLCWVPTGPASGKNRAVRETWAKRCHKMIFFTPEVDHLLGDTVALEGTKEGKKYLWSKTRAALLYLYLNYLEEHDFFLKADDDTYVIVENLLSLLSGMNPERPAYLGQRFKHLGADFMSGGPGYVLSRGALRLMAERGLDERDPLCIAGTEEFGEDAAVGDCLKKLKVPFVDTLDPDGKNRFLHTSVAASLTKDESWEHFRQFFYYWSPEGRDCCASDAVSFHRISPEQMYAIDYLVYELKVSNV